MQHENSGHALQLIADAIQILQEENLSQKTAGLRLKAIRALPSYLRAYLDRNLPTFLIDAVCEKKISFIMQATTLGETKEIMTPPRPVWTATGLTCRSPYHIPEEELLMWVYVSPYHNLIPAAYERYVQLFDMVMGTSAKELMLDEKDSVIDFNF